VVRVLPSRFEVYEKVGTLWVSVQDPANAGQVVKNPAKCAGQAVQAAKVALKSVVGSPVANDAAR
jgi:hypothetical protein